VKDKKNLGPRLKHSGATVVILMLLTSPACAEWVKVGTSNTAAHYVDPASVRKDGDFRQVWLLQDMVEADLDGVRSVRALQEINCADGRYRYLSVTAYSGPMASGHVVVEHGMRDGWSVIPVILFRSAVAGIVCGK
jgi:hypothetical protein